MNNSGQTRLADGTHRIRFTPSHKQLTTIVDDVDSFLEDNERDLLQDDNEGVVGQRLYKLRRSLEQVRIVASELEREPDPAILAQRIYERMKDFASAGVFKDGMVPGYVYNAIGAVLFDQYRHLGSIQREEIRRMTASIMAAGDGGENTMSVSEARALMVREDWSIADMLEHCQLEEDGLRERLEFDPDTGKPWED